MSNVIAFPKAKRDSPPQSMEELLENVEFTRKEHIEYVMDEVLSFAFSRVYDEGFDLGQEDCLKTTALLVESFRSALYNTCGLHHPFHEMANDVFNIVDGDEAVDILSKDE
jgi:hypothetical protein